MKTSSHDEPTASTGLPMSSWKRGRVYKTCHINIAEHATIPWTALLALADIFSCPTVINISDITYVRACMDDPATTKQAPTNTFCPMLTELKAVKAKPRNTEATPIHWVRFNARPRRQREYTAAQIVTEE
mmetsp:Transcript_33741/g.49403  ORF Transcript_33741/g.49403 Transcript_33741/m.49403 type:complete len:130 (-) Transcript_33741:183-572(-)